MQQHEIKAIIEEFLNRLAVSYTEVAMQDDPQQQGSVIFMIQTEESPLLIGSRGESLMALSHLVHRVVGRRCRDNEQPFFIVDVNDYQKKKIDLLKQNARILAERAKTFKHDVDMEPQNSYERMIVHALFSDDPTVRTESAGSGPTRHIVIKYIGDF